MDQPALWVRPLGAVQFRIFLCMDSSANIFHAAYEKFEALFFTALVSPADALKTAACGDSPTLVLVSGF